MLVVCCWIVFVSTDSGCSHCIIVDAKGYKTMRIPTEHLTVYVKSSVIYHENHTCHKATYVVVQMRTGTIGSHLHVTRSKLNTQNSQQLTTSLTVTTQNSLYVLSDAFYL